jgi:quinol-cytochrome oxidoreductase complex cytochrome b subunit
MLTIIHFALLHEYGSSNGTGMFAQLDNLPFLPYYGAKDVYSIIFVLFILVCFVIIAPDTLGHSDNFI